MIHIGNVLLQRRNKAKLIKLTAYTSIKTDSSMSYSYVTVTTKSPYEHRDLVDFCESRDLKYVEDVLINLSELDEKYRRPTKALKLFCGPQCANSKGLLQPMVAVDLILRTARRLNLDRVGGVIELNETLQEVLNTTETSVLISSLPSRVAALFTDA